MRLSSIVALFTSLTVLFTGSVFAGSHSKWIKDEFQPSTLSEADQMKEMEWFMNAAKPFAGMEINVLSETIPTHEYESKVLTQAFEEITGIKVNHQLLGEGEVVQAVQTQMQTGRNLYDAYINDSDLIGTHSRMQLAYNLTDFMAGDGADVTNPINRDRIVEISMLKVFPNGTEELRTYRINPQIPIPKEASAVHGIYDEDVIDKPSFNQLAPELNSFLEICDFGGFNSNKFDFPLLVEEFYRADIEFEINNRKFIDVQRIFHKMEPRNLTAAYKFYCDKNLENAHSAEADTIATYEVLKAQLDRYEDLENDTSFLAEFSTRQKFADFAGFIRYDKDGNECFSFGKHKGKKVTEILETEPGYFGWLLNADFPLYTKKVLTAIKLRAFNQKL